MTTTGLYGVRIPTLEPGSDPWMRVMSASKIAAVVGLSTYESPFSLYYRMAGVIPVASETDEIRRGHYLEPGVAQWFADQHPSWVIEPGGSWQHPERAWQVSNPDRMVKRDDGVPAGLECKTAADSDEWGPAGSEIVPAGYRAQAMWQMDTTGARLTYIAVLLPYLEFREYVIEYDADEADYYVARGAAFMDSLPGGSKPRDPNIDSHSQTYQALRSLHPDIDPTVDAVIAPSVGRRYVAAINGLKRAEERKNRASSMLLTRMGSARRAVCQGQQLAIRIPGRGDAPPSLRSNFSKKEASR